MLVKEAKEITGGGILNGNTKMPGATYATDPFLCITGQKLRKQAHTSCSKCYAVKIAKLRPSAAKGYNSRHMAMARASHDLYGPTGVSWVDAMVFMINKYAEKTGDYEFRWFDAGDVPHRDSFELIAWVASRTPKVKHWIPTKEYKWYSQWINNPNTVVPVNMVVRVSTPKVDGRPLTGVSHSSTVHHKQEHSGHECKAYRTDKNNKVWSKDEFKALTRQEKKVIDFGHCGNCRACWSKDVKNVSYGLH